METSCGTIFVTSLPGPIVLTLLFVSVLMWAARFAVPKRRWLIRAFPEAIAIIFTGLLVAFVADIAYDEFTGHEHFCATVRATRARDLDQQRRLAMEAMEDAEADRRQCLLRNVF